MNIFSLLQGNPFRHIKNGENVHFISCTVKYYKIKNPIGMILSFRTYETAFMQISTGQKSTEFVLQHFFFDSYLTSTPQISQELRCGKSIYRQILMGVMVFNATFNNISAISYLVSFIGGGNRRTWRKPPTCTCRKSN